MLGTMSLAASLTLAAQTTAAVPTYRVQVIADVSTTTTTTLRGSSDQGHLVGDQVIAGINQAFVATPADGLQILPLPPGYQAALAFDANDAGVVVGTASIGTFPWDSGNPVAWTPNGAGGYNVHVLQNFTTAPGPFGQMSIQGGQAIAINNAGTIVGWCRFQGFIGGPTVRYDLNGAPLNLRELGFEASVTAINDNNVIVGAELRMDIDSGVVTTLGLPSPLQPAGTHFTNVLAYAINNQNEVVVAADLASTVFENYLTFIHNDTDGYIRLNPAQLPSRYVGFYDNNDLGDVSASGGVLFRAEGALLPGFDGLLRPEDAAWDTAIGFIDNDRRVATTAHTGLDTVALVWLVPVTPTCPGDATGDGFVDFEDLNSVLSNWGQGATAGDVDGDGQTNFTDLNLVLSNWEQAC